MTNTIRTGIQQLDQMTGGGIEKGEVWVVTAPTAWGKSSLGLALHEAAVATGSTPVIATWEDVPELYQERLARMRPNSTSAQASILNFIGVRWNDALVKSLGLMVEGEGIDLVIIDYLQAFWTDKALHEETRAQMMANVIAGIDWLASTGVAVVVLSQNSDPTKALVNRAGVYLKGFDDDDGSKRLHLQKNRHGECGEVTLNWDATRGVFSHTAP